MYSTAVSSSSEPVRRMKGAWGARARELERGHAAELRERGSGDEEVGKELAQRALEVGTRHHASRCEIELRSAKLHLDQLGVGVVVFEHENAHRHAARVAARHGRRSWEKPRVGPGRLPRIQAARARPGWRSGPDWPRHGCRGAP